MILKQILFYRLIICTILFNTILNNTGFSQIKIDSLKDEEFPVGLFFKGYLYAAYKWYDKQGENIIVFTEDYDESYDFGNSSGTFISRRSSAELYVYKYIKKNGKYISDWKFKNSQIKCVSDVEAVFINNTFRLTDLNKDGKSEVWFMYKKRCSSDYGPADMRLVLYKDKQKFEMSGTNKIVLGEETVGGEYKFDMYFNAAPLVIKRYAKELWQCNIWDKFESRE
jgi:hypothetical protein